MLENCKVLHHQKTIPNVLRCVSTQKNTFLARFFPSLSSPRSFFLILLFLVPSYLSNLHTHNKTPKDQTSLCVLHFAYLIHSGANKQNKENKCQERRKGRERREKRSRGGRTPLREIKRKDYPPVHLMGKDFPEAS